MPHAPTPQGPFYGYPAACPRKGTKVFYRRPRLGRALTWTTVLVRYGEIGIKSHDVRSQFERRLHDNIEAQFLARGLEGLVQRERGRVLVHTPTAEKVLDALAHTFGVVSASAAEPLPADLAPLCAALAERTRGMFRAGQSFAVRARRSGAQGYTSMDLGREAGSAVVGANPGLRVDLTAPDVEVFIEARSDKAYLYWASVPGPGGLPMGSQGRVVAAVETPDSAHALWLALRRGTSATVFAWDGPGGDVDASLRALAAWVPNLKVHLVAPPPAGPSRAAALAAAREFAWRRDAYAVVVGDSLPDLAPLGPLDAAAKVPVFRPLTGYPPGRLRELALRDRLPLAPSPAPPPGEAPPEGWAHAAVKASRVLEVKT